MTDIPELDPTDRERMEILHEQAREIADAAHSGDNVGFGAAFAAFGQAAKQIDQVAFLNSLHVPKDAGEWEDGLRAILARIPDGWGRWISCDRGWYPLLVALDRALAELLPDYEVHQAKEKYATLRYYWAPAALAPPGDPEPQPERTPTPGLKPAEDPLWQAYCTAHTAWGERKQAWLETAEGQTALADLEARYAAAEKLVAAAEAASAQTCERCGEPGELRQKLTPYPWLKTLCASCGEGLVTRDVWEAWWEEHEEAYRAEAHARALESFVKAHSGKRILVACVDESRVLRVPATYVRDAAEAAAVLHEQWDELWVANDVAGNAVIERLTERYRVLASVEELRLRTLHGPLHPRVQMKGAPQFYEMGGFPSQASGISALLRVGLSVMSYSADISFVTADEA
jgi:hypothetical protein